MGVVLTFFLLPSALFGLWIIFSNPASKYIRPREGKTRAEIEHIKEGSKTGMGCFVFCSVIYWLGLVFFSIAALVSQTGSQILSLIALITGIGVFVYIGIKSKKGIIEAKKKEIDVEIIDEDSSEIRTVSSEIIMDKSNDLEFEKSSLSTKIFGYVVSIFQAGYLWYLFLVNIYIIPNILP